MQKVSLENYPNGRQGFVIKQDEEQLAEMIVAVTENRMTVYHTEVAEQAEGMGLGKILLQEMVAHARKHQLKVISLCVFVSAQFKRHPEMYADIWENASGLNHFPAKYCC